MNITGSGWEFFIQRQSEQTRDGRTRTVGTYQIFHDGDAQGGARMSGMVAESRGPGANAPGGNGRRIREGRYPLFTQDGGHYVTIGYVISGDFTDTPKPGLELKETDERSEILIHPGHGFLASIGCINPCTSLPDADENIDFEPSRDRVIEIIDDLKDFAGHDFPARNGHRIPNAFVVIDGEP
jgi:hypothetical protein